MAVVSLFSRTFSNRAFCLKKVKRRMFHTFGLKDILIKRLKDINISNPTPIQEKVSRMERSHGLRKVKNLAHPFSNFLRAYSLSSLVGERDLFHPKFASPLVTKLCWWQCKCIPNM